MSGVNYSKWDHIEISDDEDDTHPNVDTPSLFKWRHEARLQREAEEKQRKAKAMLESQKRMDELSKLEQQIKQVDVESEKERAAILKSKAEDIKKQEEEFRSKEAELTRYEKAHPKWNVDNISKPKYEKTLINKPAAAPVSSNDLSEEEVVSDMTQFFKKYDKEMRQFAMLSKYEDSQKFLLEHSYLLKDHLASFLVVYAIDLECEGKTELMKRVARQCIVVQYIFELARTLKADPRDTIAPFFTRIKTAEKQYTDAFDDEYHSFLLRVKERAEARLERARAEVEQEEKQKRLGPGGLDPLVVLEELPPKIKEAFETQNTPLLQEGFAELPKEEAEKYFKMCVDSGLWVPKGNENATQEQGEGEGEEEEEFEDAADTLD